MESTVQNPALAAAETTTEGKATKTKARLIGYWVSTGLVAFMMLPAGAMQIAQLPQQVEGFAKLGYQPYFMVMLGVWKLLGGIAILVPRFPRVKEWAYAGIFIDLSSAAISNACRGNSVGHVVAPLVCAAILACSWALRPQSRVLGVLRPTKA